MMVTTWWMINVTLLFPILAFICGFLFAKAIRTEHLKAAMSLCLARIFIPIVIIYNMVFYQSGSLSLMLFSFISAFILFFIFLFFSHDRLRSLCFSYSNMAWLGFPIAMVIFGPESSSAIVALYIGGSIFGNIWAVTSVSSESQSIVELSRKVLSSPPVLALLLAAIFRIFNVQSMQHHEWVDTIYQLAKWGMSFTGMCVLGMWLSQTRVHVQDLLSSVQVAIFKVVCGALLCALTYWYVPIPHIDQYIGVMFLLFCLPPAANIVALETHYQGTGVSAKYIASGTIVSCVVCMIYGLVIHLL